MANSENDFFNSALDCFHDFFFFFWFRIVLLKQQFCVLQPEGRLTPPS